MEIGIYYSYTERGPGKVVSNLLKQLEYNGIRYRINSDGDKNIILQNCNRLNGNLLNCILGPNICTLPIDNPILINYEKYNKLLVPSDWVKELYNRWIPKYKIFVWPVGIDTKKFLNTEETIKEFEFLIYFKRRSNEDLLQVINKLIELKKTYTIIEYGNYTESEFIEKIKKSKFGLVIDNCESQGIAIQEMMSCNLPLLVWDVKSWVDRGTEHMCNSTSIPYWSNDCGEFFYDINELPQKINTIKNNTYNPRNYIIDNLDIYGKINKNILI